MSLRTPLSKARGLGAAKTGVSHWWWQRLTALALLPLILWFCFAVASLPSSGYFTVLVWIQSPLVAALLCILILATLYHAYLGLQVVIEDYVAAHAWRMGLIIASGFLAVLLTMVGLLAVLRIFIGG